MRTSDPRIYKLYLLTFLDGYVRDNPKTGNPTEFEMSSSKLHIGEVNTKQFLLIIYNGKFFLRQINSFRSHG